MLTQFLDFYFLWYECSILTSYFWTPYVVLHKIDRHEPQVSDIQDHIKPWILVVTSNIFIFIAELCFTIFLGGISIAEPAAPCSALTIEN